MTAHSSGNDTLTHHSLQGREAITFYSDEASIGKIRNNYLRLAQEICLSTWDVRMPVGFCLRQFFHMKIKLKVISLTGRNHCFSLTFFPFLLSVLGLFVTNWQ
jgi:hypothetical protein